MKYTLSTAIINHMDNQSNPADQLQPVSERLAELIPASRDAMPAIELYMDQVLEYIAQNPVSFSGEDKQIGRAHV